MTNHKEAAMFSKVFSTCKKYEDNEEFCSLVLKLFGSQEDKRIACLVADWAKSRKYEGGEKVKESTRGKVKNDNPMPCPPAFPMPPMAASQDFSPRQQCFRGGRGGIFSKRKHKRLRFDPDIRERELSASLDPEKALGLGFTECSWVNAIGEIT
ncbi:unnamed protein product [Mytilus coruscus]|uniref:Uncharacterized protein n=1 Tax=Mytilus coruscus TaxID=42192 RepID=A0A6J8C028_MYTCO|nr:unnamed protein product [Mytilus coruscus]